MQNERKAVTRLTLDLQLGDVQKSFGLTKTDVNRRLEFTLIDGGRPFEIPSNWTVWLVGTKPDGTDLKLGCVVERGRVIYDLASGNQLSACEGYFQIWLTIFNEAGEEVYSPGVGVDVRPGPNTMNSEDQNTAIASLIAKINGTQEEVGEIQSRLPELAREVRLSTLTITKNQWEDSDPKYATATLPNVEFGENTSTTSYSALLLPVDNATRIESRSIGIFVKATYMDSIGIVNIVFERKGEAPTMDLKYVVIAFTEPNETGKAFPVSVGFIGIGASSTDQLEADVEALEDDVDGLKKAVKQNSDSIADLKEDLENGTVGGGSADLGDLPDRVTIAEAEIDNIETRLNELNDEFGEEGRVSELEKVGESYKIFSEITFPQAVQRIDGDIAAAESLVPEHNVSLDSHQDIRGEIKKLADELEAVLDSDDETLDELSEIVRYIKSNKSLIDAITTSKVNVADIIDNLSTNVANKPLSAGQGVELKKVLDTLSVRVEDLEFVPVNISDFKSSITTAEKGATVNDVTLSWQLNKTPNPATDSLMLDGEFITLAKSGELDLTEQGITSNRKWVLTATDRKGSATKEASLTFYNGVYYGVSEAPAAYDSQFIIALGESGKKVLRGSKLTSFTVTAGEGEYIYYCLPKSMGTCSFKVGGFDGGFELAATISYTNEPGHTEDYYIYRSSNAGLGATTVEVK